MCFSSSKSSNASKSNQEDNRIAGEGGAIVARADGSNSHITVESADAEFLEEGLDFLRAAGEGLFSFGNEILKVTSGFAASSFEGQQDTFDKSRAFAKGIIEQQNPNDANRIQTIVLALIAAGGIYFIWGKK